MYGAQEFNDTSDTPDLGESLGHGPPKQAVPPQYGPSGYYAQPDCCPGVMWVLVYNLCPCVMAILTWGVLLVAWVTPPLHGVKHYRPGVAQLALAKLRHWYPPSESRSPRSRKS